MNHAQWQALLHAKMQKQMVDRWVAEHTPMCMPPKPVFIAVRKVLGIAVYAFMRYPMPNGKFETTYERIA
jgi:hypothetical protein